MPNELDTRMDDGKTAKDMNWVLLRNVSDDGEADLIEALLGTEGIPMVRKNKKNGEFVKLYMGVSRFGVDVFVPEEHLELAEAMVSAKPEELPDQAADFDSEKEAQRFDMKKRGVAWAILLYILLPIIAAVLISNLFK